MKSITEGSVLYILGVACGLWTAVTVSRCCFGGEAGIIAPSPAASQPARAEVAHATASITRALEDAGLGGMLPKFLQTHRADLLSRDGAVADLLADIEKRQLRVVVIDSLVLRVTGNSQYSHVVFHCAAGAAPAKAAARASAPLADAQWEYLEPFIREASASGGRPRMPRTADTQTVVLLSYFDGQAWRTTSWVNMDAPREYTAAFSAIMELAEIFSRGEMLGLQFCPPDSRVEEEYRRFVARKEGK